MKILLALLGLSLFLLISFTNCSKDEDPLPPTMSLNSTAGFVSENTTAHFGDTLYFGVTANSNGSDNLVKFTISANNQMVFDSTINTANFTFNFYIVKGANDVEAWTMEVTDQAGNKANKSVTITGDFGEIDNYTTILLGAQANVETESFLSLSNNLATTYFQADAFDHQADIDMLCYFEDVADVLMTIASPGANIAGIFSGATSPDNYTTKNTTNFVKTELSASMFDAVQNDARILEVYDAANTNKKAKDLTVGDVYAFKLESGKNGIFKVVDVTAGTTGSVTLAIKVQK